MTTRAIDVVVRGDGTQVVTKFEDLHVPFQHVSDFRIDKVLVHSRLASHPYLLLRIPELDDTHTMAAAVGGYCALYPRRIIGNTLTLDPQSVYTPRQAVPYCAKLTFQLVDPATGRRVEAEAGDVLIVHATMRYREHVNYGY